MQQQDDNIQDLTPQALAAMASLNNDLTSHVSTWIYQQRGISSNLRYTMIVHVLHQISKAYESMQRRDRNNPSMGLPCDNDVPF